MIYRGRDFRPVYEWRPSKGSLALHVVVKMLDGAPVSLAEVTIPGFLTTPVITDGSGRVTIEGVPRGNISVHAQKVIGGVLVEGDGCYVPAQLEDETSQDLLLVDCKDFGKVLDPNAVTEATVILNPGAREEFRKVTFSASLLLEDCNCLTGNDYATRAIFQVCRVSPLERDADVGMPQTDLCIDEIGVKFFAHCRLLEDNRTVRVTGGFELYEDASGTCGATDQEDSRSFSVDVRPGEAARPFVSALVNEDICFAGPFPYACHDRASLEDFRIVNDRAD